FDAWVKRNVHPHKVPGYAAVTLSLKKTGVPTGDVTADQMDAIAALADRYSFGELRVSHEQNLILADVRSRDLPALWREARELGLNISGCMNACGHHHVGHVGILGVDKNGEEWYQVEIGGNQAPGALGKVIGPSFARADIPDVIERLIDTYLEQRDSEAERFV